jgi:hypothetical protein
MLLHRQLNVVFWLFAAVPGGFRARLFFLRNPTSKSGCRFSRPEGPLYT